MGDIPLNLDLSQFLAPTYTNHPRLAEHAVYDPLLKAFVVPQFEVPAAKARKAVKPGAKSAKGQSQPSVRVVDDGVEKKFLCERAKSSMSRCRKCGQSIVRDTLRFGYPSPDPRGEYGAIPIWFHIRCSPLDFVGFPQFDATIASLCFGFSALTAEDQKEVFETAGKGYTVSKLLNGEDAEYADDFEEEPLSDRLVQRRGVSVALLAAPAELTGATLLPFQQEGFSWMVAQEANPATKGGILADEMGMGKTLQTIALIVAKRETVRPTLVVCPVAAVMQWYSEIQKFLGPETLSIHVYHGSQKISAEKLTQFDVVLTTYQTLENEYRKQANLAKVMCKHCRRMFLPGKLGFHLKYMCGPNAMRTLKQSLREVKDKGATEKAKRTMGIESSDTAPTIRNVLRDVIKQSGLVNGTDVDNMNQYEMMSLYKDKQVGSVGDGAGDGVGKPEDVKDEDTTVLSRKTVAELKSLLMEYGVKNFAKNSKKSDLIDLVIDAGLGDIAKSQTTFFTGTGRGRTAGSRRSTVTEAGTERRSAASKALAKLKDVSSSDESTAVPVLRKRKAVEIAESDAESSSDSSSDASSGSSSESSSWSSEGSESSGETVDVFTDSDSDVASVRGKRRAPPVAPRGRAAPKASTQPASKKPRYDADAVAENDSEEEAVEDVDLSASPLHCVQWGRLVLDEAHRIKQRTNSTSLAAFAVAAEFRWCLSGTPLQNRVGELYSLVRFLRFSPFAHYFCKGCDCCSLHFRFIDNRFCAKCGCARTKHFSYFKQVISGPIVKYGVGDGSALNVLKTQVLDVILLRRTKLERQADLNLPPMTIEVKKFAMSQEQRDFYESLYKQSMLKFDTFAKSGTLLHNYAHIFDLLTRLRQALDHPYLIVYGADYTVPTVAGVKSSGICALCQDDIGDEPKASAACGHVFHADCVKEYIREAPQLPSGGCGCPSCFQPLTVIFDQTSSGPTPDVDEDLGAEAPNTVPAKARRPDSIMDRVSASGFQS